MSTETTAALDPIDAATTGRLEGTAPCPSEAADANTQQRMIMRMIYAVLAHQDRRSLVAIAITTGEGQIFRHAGTAVLERNNVIEMERQLGEGFREAAIFASVPGSGADGFVNRLIHIPTQPVAFLCSERRAFALRNSKVRPTLR